MLHRIAWPAIGLLAGVMLSCGGEEASPEASPGAGATAGTAGNGAGGSSAGNGAAGIAGAAGGSGGAAAGAGGVGGAGGTTAGTSGAGGTTAGTSGAGGAAGSSGAAADASIDASPCGVLAAGPFDGERTVPGVDFGDRAYDLHLPPGYDCTEPVPVVVVLHGGGHFKEKMAQVTCPDPNVTPEPSDVNAAGCMNAVADAKGFAVVYPNGTKSSPTGSGRTWNAGGGSDGYECISEPACGDGRDDVGYVSALLDELQTAVNVDPKRVFATGASNGAALSHRLACELSDRIAAIAPVAGGNQFAAVLTCAPPRPVPVLHIHGDADPKWAYLGDTKGLPPEKWVGIPAVGVAVGPSSMLGWITHNGCSTTPTTTTVQSVTVDSYGGCSDGADTVLYTIADGGHTWPGGWQFAPAATGLNQVGPVNYEINASEVMLDFFAAHPMP